MSVGIVGVAYLAVLALGMATHGRAEPIGDPILAVMEVLTIMSALPLIAVSAALHMVVPLERKLMSLIALCFTVLFAGTTTLVHFVELSASRQLGATHLAWPSAAYAAELLAWDLFLGVALLCAAQALAHTPDARRVRGVLRMAGTLCVVGVVGSLTGQMRAQFIAGAGYAVVLPIGAFLLAAWFRRAESLSV